MPITRIKKHILNLPKGINTAKNSDAGFTLIELLVSLAIFITVVTVASTIFSSSLRLQRQSLAQQELIDQTSYVIEYMTRALRMAIKDDIEIWGFPSKNCLGGDKVNYEFSDNCLKFRNYKNECQEFCLDGTKLKEIKNGIENDLTSPDLKVKKFEITLTGEGQDNEIQPLVTIFLEIGGKEEANIKIQTSVSQRNLDVKR